MGKGSIKSYLLVYATGMCLYFTMAVLLHLHAHCEVVAFEYCSFNMDIYDGEVYIKEIMPRTCFKAYQTSFEKCEGQQTYHCRFLLQAPYRQEKRTTSEFESAKQRKDLSVACGQIN